MTKRRTIFIQHRKSSNLKRLLLVAPTAIYVSIAGLTARAEPLPGLEATYYTIDETPPNRNLETYLVCATEVENNINRSYDGEPVDGCPTDLFAAHLAGTITIPEHETIEFFLASDDGGEATIGGHTFGAWWDQGCSATLSGELDLEPGETPLDVIFYENGGATCLMLAWRIDGGSWEIVPDDAYTQEPTPDTTVPDTSIPETTIAETTIPETSSSSTTTSSTTTTTQAPPPAPIYTPPATTTSSTTTEPSTTTTTEPPTTLPETTIPETSLPTPSTSLVELSPSTSNAPETTTPTLIAPETLLEPPSKPAEDAPLDEPAEATAAEIVIALANPETVANLTSEQAAEVFAELHVKDLTQQLADRLVDALQDAPEEIRAEFEDAIDVYSGLFDRYVPIGSTVPVSTRRTLTAVSGLALATAASVRIRR